MTFDEVGAPARLSGGPSPATNIPVVQIGPVVQALAVCKVNVNRL